MNVFRYKDYRKLINDWLESDERHGARSKLSQAIGCSPSWITRVLSGSVQLTPDQAFGACQYFRLTEAETDYVMLLVELERAASAALKKRIQARLKRFEQEARELRSMVKTDTEITDEDRNLYYSSWVYAAVHVAVMIRAMTTDELALRLRLPSEVVDETLGSLKGMSLVENQGARWKATSMSIHLPAGHVMAKIGHAIWRNKTIGFLQEGPSSGLHYSAIHCLSKSDVETIREKLKAAVLDCRKTIEPSPSETLAVLCVDWYEQ